MSMFPLVNMMENQYCECLEGKNIGNVQIVKKRFDSGVLIVVKLGGPGGRMMEPERCGNCKCWYEVSFNYENRSFGHCLRYPPRYFQERYPDPDDIGTPHYEYTVQANVVYADKWCGEWREKGMWRSK